MAEQRISHRHNGIVAVAFYMKLSSQCHHVDRRLCSLPFCEFNVDASMGWGTVQFAVRGPSWCHVSPEMISICSNRCGGCGKLPNWALALLVLNLDFTVVSKGHSTTSERHTPTPFYLHERGQLQIPVLTISRILTVSSLTRCAHDHGNVCIPHPFHLSLHVPTVLILRLRHGVFCD
jgi:hypothetical protein